MPTPSPLHESAQRSGQLLALGENLRQHRIAANFSAADVAARIGVTEKTYRALESGLGSAKLSTLAAVLALYGLDDQLGRLALPAIGHPARAISTQRRRVSRSKAGQC
jgi:transcriptional regulator with XRE-family HTH domain